MDQTITIQALMQMGGLIVGAWAFIKIVMEIIRSITARHDREQAWDKAVKDIEVDREALKKIFNDRLDDQDAKIQQLYAMMVMFMRSQNAILEALIEQGIGNGEIKAIHKELNEFITDQIMK